MNISAEAGGGTMSEQYKTAKDLVEDAGNWGVFVLAKAQKTPAQVPEILAEVFLDAAFHHDDETACQLSQWLMKAEEDVILIPLLKEGDRGRKVLPHDLGPLSEEMRQVARAKAKRAMRFYEDLPTFSDGTIWVLHSHDEGHQEQVQKSTLLETKRYLLGVVARWWCDTEDEEEADTLFEFFLNAPTRFNEEVEMLEKVLRNETGHDFPVTHLGRHISTLAPEGIPDYNLRDQIKILKILKLAWVRNQDGAQMGSIARALLPLQIIEASNEAFILFASLALRVAELDEQGQEIRDLLQWKDGRKHSNRFGGEVSVFYPTFTSIEFSITFIRGDLEAEDLHAFFDQAKTTAEDWRKSRKERDLPTPRIINLKFILVPRYESGKKPETFREVEV